MNTTNFRLQDFGDFRSRRALSERLLAQKILHSEGGQEWNICLCCGFPTLEEAFGSCYLCDFEDDTAYARLPEVQDIGPNGGFSLTEYRDFFQKYLTHYPPHAREGLVEYFPEVRELRRLIIRIFLQLFGEHHRDRGLPIAVAYARDALLSVRFSVSQRYPDRSEEPMEN